MLDLKDYTSIAGDFFESKMKSRVYLWLLLGQTNSQSEVWPINCLDVFWCLRKLLGCTIILSMWTQHTLCGKRILKNASHSFFQWKQGSWGGWIDEPAFSIQSGIWINISYFSPIMDWSEITSYGKHNADGLAATIQSKCTHAENFPFENLAAWQSVTVTKTTRLYGRI